MYMCIFVQYCTHVHHTRHSKKRHPTAPATVAGVPATPICPTYAARSVTPHAFDEFVCSSNKSVPCVHRAVCTVPRRGCEHAKAPAQPSYARCSPDGASARAATLQLSGSGWPTVLGRLAEHYLASASRRRPLVSQQRRRLTLHCCSCSRDRSRPDRLQLASVQSKQCPGTGAALWLNRSLCCCSAACPVVRAARITLPRSLRMPWSEEGAGAKRGVLPCVCGCGCVSEVCCPGWRRPP